MAEVGVVRFAHVARAVAETVLPSSRSTYAKHLLTQPSLLSILCLLCLMRDEDWTFREAAVRLGEQQELRAALGLERVPDDTTRSRFVRRLEAGGVTQALTAAVARLPPPAPEGQVVAVDATGCSPTAARRSLVDRTRHRGTARTRQHGPQGGSRWMCCGPSDGGSSPMGDPPPPRRRDVRSSTWPGRRERLASS
jgi:hypothetical protein